MILAEDLRKAILQAAIQGKLVEQRPEEGTGEELYSRTQEKKAALIKRGKIKREKALPEITEDEIPFDIPKNWMWVRLSDVVDVRDGTHDSPRYYSTGVPLVTSKNISSGELDFSNIKYISQEDADAINQRSFVDDGDILFAMIGSIGNPVIVKKECAFCIKNVALFKVFAKEDLLIEYLFWYLTFEQYELRRIAKGGVQSFVSLKAFRTHVFPLPPYGEQVRICRKLKNVLSEIDSYATAEQELTSLQSAFPDDVRKSILQYAMQGKLVEQRPEEGTGEELYQQIQAEKEKLVKEGKIKKEKSLPEITDEDTPFDIPESWKWVRFGDVVDFRLGKTPPRTDAKSWGNDYKWISISDMVSDGHVSETKEGISQSGFESVFGATISPKGTLIMSFKLTIGCVSILDIDALHNEAIISIFPIVDENTVMRDYLFKIMPSVSKTGDSKKAIKGNTLNSKSLRNLLLPLPPLEEQQRIVEKLDKILPLTDSIKEAI